MCVRKGGIIMTKCYQVFYWIKKNKMEYLEHIFIYANNAREACKKCKEVVKNKTGRNAFRPSINPPTDYEMEQYRKNWRYYVVD